jgi:ABC-type nitrate/sulfonate/bicarbonate transport system ATPase subunit
LPKRKIISLVGPSGCGKTTILSIAAGFLRPAGGRVSWAEPESGNADAKRHPVTMLFQKDTLLPWLTVAENVGLYFRLKRTHLSKREQRERVSELIALAGLDDVVSKYPYQLSGGQRRRVAFLAAVAPLPRTLLLDEPFSSLDEPTRVAIHQDTYAIVRRYGITVMLVTHDLAEAISLSDEVAILSRAPAKIVERNSIGFGSERDMLALRESPEFLRLYGHLWDTLAAEIRKDPAARLATAHQ